MKGTFLQAEDVGTSEDVSLLLAWDCSPRNLGLHLVSHQRLSHLRPTVLDIQGQETPWGSTQATEGFPTSKQNGDLPLRVHGLSFPVDR